MGRSVMAKATKGKGIPVTDFNHGEDIPERDIQVGGDTVSTATVQNSNNSEGTVIEMATSKTAKSGVKHHVSVGGVMYNTLGKFEASDKKEYELVGIKNKAGETRFYFVVDNSFKIDNGDGTFQGRRGGAPSPDMAMDTLPDDFDIGKAFDAPESSESSGDGTTRKRRHPVVRADVPDEAKFVLAAIAVLNGYEETDLVFAIDKAYESLLEACNVTDAQVQNTVNQLKQDRAEPKKYVPSRFAVKPSEREVGEEG